MILGLGKRYPSVEDEGIISNMITDQTDICIQEYWWDLEREIWGTRSVR